MLAATPKALSVEGRAVEATTRTTEPVVYWAAIGVIIMAFWAWIMIKWVTGPFFTPTVPGPTSQPEWQNWAQIVFQAVMILALFVVGYRVIIKPWRQERRFTTDGGLFIAYFTMFFQDQITFMGGGYWFLYNAHVFNMGSWFPEIPGWMAFAQPGQTAGEPILMMGPGYAYFFIIMTFISLWIMRKFKAIWPWMTTPLLFFWVIIATALMDMVIEIGFWIPLGFYTYTYGGILPMINRGSVQEFPLVEALWIGVLSAFIAALRYYSDDKGHTVVERGLDKVTSSPLKQAFLRLFALIAAIQLIFFFFYNVPMYQLGSWSRDWPKSIQEISYFMSGICGAGTPRACRTSDTPIIVPGPNAITVTPEAQLFVPEGAQKPQGAVPFVKAHEQGWIDWGK